MFQSVVLSWLPREKAFLDSKDLTPFLRKDRSVFDILIEISNTFCEEIQEKEINLSKVSPLDFINYIEHRYENVKFYKYSDMRVS